MLALLPVLLLVIRRRNSLVEIAKSANMFIPYIERIDHFALES
jgi:hypothetical protein